MKRRKKMGLHDLRKNIDEQQKAEFMRGVVNDAPKDYHYHCEICGGGFKSMLYIADLDFEPCPFCGGITGLKLDTKGECDKAGDLPF